LPKLSFAEIYKWNCRTSRRLEIMDKEYQICFCTRCGDKCKVASERNPNAEMLRKSATPEGVCLECAVTEWFANTYPINMQIDRSPHGAKSLLIPPLQQRFGDIMRAANANADLSEIDWKKVVKNWDLPCQVELSMVNLYMPRNAVVREETEKPKGKKTVGR